MGVTALIATILEENKIAVAFLALLAYPISNAIYNIYFHPLAKFPGPKLWTASRLPFIYYLLTGQLVKKVKEFHDIYGEFYRLAPDEVSFASEQAWNDIYTFRRGHKRALRDKVWYIAPNNQADNLITKTDFKFHARVRGLMSNSFTDEALRTQHPLIESHADMLISKIREAAEKPENSTRGARINITDWLNFFTMDIIGDLAFGAPFGCLEKGEYHHWVRTLFSYLKGMSIAAAPRFYPTMEFLFQKLIPKRIVEEQRQHSAYAEKMINRRLDTKGDRPDFMTPFMRNNVNFENMSREEIVSTFNFIIVGGSETSATVMTGIFNHLTRKKNKGILDRLCNDIRTKFREEKEITLDAIQSTSIPYLEAVINEGLRICNPIPSGLPRVVPEGGDEYCGIFLPGDPDEFVPERWLPKDQQPKKFANDQLSASKPFSVGFHSCLGRPLAWAEIRLAVTRLLWTFDFSVDAEDEVDFDEFPVIMIIQKAPMNLRAKIRPGI
ncbi:uncharacterized protein EAE98_007885 [Botrytis deweyae]|uniref:Cytochrome P450 n=1 Tax=Botrytis deweyae TaxID=2478750 RepID=A0ABQ7IGJ9_9HELO|nr:uncharacterized protein EAE98_007885 [Botrytis deweyae]KAF7923180.1 hypothetical protein EAE98_007885 [Botrytis deweyae]